jgi:aminoglycoside 6'-N-acetyltransferase I
MVATASVRIVLASEPDRADWRRLRGELWPHLSEEESNADISNMLATGWCCLIARDASGVALGFAEATLRHDYVEGCETSPVGFLEGIYVSPPFRRRGVARSLVDAVEAWARTQSAELASDAAIHNVDSQNFHRACGFEETRRVVYFRKKLT